ncbi:roundabout homolog 1-like isoform X3 [Dysidea avara]|uniref:roundabout homolog 1-like isoform X3 n=1 Tax=Dysidea avara TaxID=196820 RepID=UPI00332319D4
MISGTNLVVLIITSVVVNISSAQALRFIMEPEDRVVFPGINVSESFPCSFEESATNVTVMWYRDGVLLPVDSTHIIHDNGTLEITDIIQGIDATVQGVVYRCVLSNEVGSIISKPALIQYAVFDDDWDSNDTIIRMVEVRIAFSILIPCNPPLANPSPTVEWTIDSSPLNVSNSKYKILPSGDLIIGNIQFGDISTDDSSSLHNYQCHVINRLIFQTVESPIIYQLHLVDVYSEDLTIFDTLEDTVLLFGSDAEFICIAIANGVQRLGYLYRRTDGNALGINTVTPTLPLSNDIERRHAMFITGVTEENAGEYECVVQDVRVGETRTLAAVMFNITVVVITVTIVSAPAGTPVSGSTNTYDYPILSSVTLTCMVTSSDGSILNVTNYQWDTTGCYTHPAHNNGNPVCFPTGQTTQSVTGNDLTAEDAGTVTCTVTIGGVDGDYTSGPLTLHISGIAMTGVLIGNSDIVTGNLLTDYSSIIGTNNGLVARCVSGLGPTGTDDNTDLGTWYFNGAQLPYGLCEDPVVNVIQSRIAGLMNFIGVINLWQCEPILTITAEGVYTCVIMDSSMMNQTTRLGVYFSGRTAPMIDPPPSSAITVAVGSPLTLFCTSQGSPPDTFTWRKDSGPIVQPTNITTVTHDSTSAVFRAGYSINNVSISDNGTYTCSVTNPIGSSSQTITVIVILILFLLQSVCHHLAPYKNL